MSELSNDLSKLSQASTDYIQSKKTMLINGAEREASDGKTFPVYDPSSGEQIAEVPHASTEDVSAAVQAAREAFDKGPWPKLKPAARERMVLKLADLLEKNAEEFAEIEAVNSGRTLINTRLFDVDLSVDYLRYMAGWATKIHGKTIDTTVPYAPGMDFFAYTKREPLGVVAGITPWNVPLGQSIWKLAPVLATGCTIVLKPAEQAPLTTLRFAQLIEAAGIPPGVVNVVTGYGHTTGAALAEHPLVDKISFTGSTETGKKIALQAVSQFKKYPLELGGKSPVIILDDADLDTAIPGAAWAIYGNHGQNCCAGSRLYVHQSIYEKVVEGIAKIAAQIKLGPALDPNTEMGPLVSREQQKRVMAYIESGVTQGASILTGGCTLEHPGFYVKPTVLVNTRQDMKVVQEEIFGPVLVASPFEDVEEMLVRANDTKYGLGASIWTQNISRMHRLVPRIKAGTVWVNTHNVLDLAVPFGGVKESGVGSELGEEAIYQHTQIKATIVNI